MPVAARWHETTRRCSDPAYPSAGPRDLLESDNKHHVDSNGLCFGLVGPIIDISW